VKERSKSIVKNSRGEVNLFAPERSKYRLNNDALGKALILVVGAYGLVCPDVLPGNPDLIISAGRTDTNPIL
jgi:hypothetical protein